MRQHIIISLSGYPGNDDPHGWQKHNHNQDVINSAYLPIRAPQDGRMFAGFYYGLLIVSNQTADAAKKS
jgi:hypothetical protein